MSSQEYLLEGAIAGAGAEPLRVLFIDVRDAIGGDSTVLLNILRQLDRRRFRAFVACHSRGALLEELQQLDGINLLPVNFGTREAQSARAGIGGKILAVRSLGQSLVCALRLITFIKRTGITVIHTNNTLRAVFIANLIAKLTGIPYIYHAHCALPDHPIQRRGAREADCVLAVSSYTAKTYEAAAVPAARTTVLYNGIATDELSPAFQSSRLRQELSLTEETKLIGLVGRVSPSKGHEDVVAVADRVVRAFPAVRFLIVGDDSIYDNNDGFLARLKSTIAERGLSDKFIFTGFRRDLRDVYAALDLVLIPSRAPEGCNMVTLEAMAMGRPVITSDAGGLPEITRDGAGITVPAGRAELLGEAIISVLGNEAEAHRLKQQGRERVLAQFNLRSFLEQFEQVLSRVAQSRLTRRI